MNNLFKDTPYSETIGSFTRVGNYPLEANYIFPTEEALKEFYSDEINKATVHKGLFKVVEDDGTGKQALYWVTTNDNGELEFTKYLTNSNNPQLPTLKTINNQSIIGEGNIDINSLTYKVVETLPTTGEANIIYLILNSSSEETDNSYTEYIWTDNKYEKLGEFNSGITKDELNKLVNKYNVYDIIVSQTYPEDSKVQELKNAISNGYYIYAYKDENGLQGTTSTPIAAEIGENCIDLFLTSANAYVHLDTINKTKTIIDKDRIYNAYWLLECLNGTYPTDAQIEELREAINNEFYIYIRYENVILPLIVASNNETEIAVGFLFGSFIMLIINTVSKTISLKYLDTTIAESAGITSIDDGVTPIYVYRYNYNNAQHQTLYSFKKTTGRAIEYKAGVNDYIICYDENGNYEHHREYTNILLYFIIDAINKYNSEITPFVTEAFNNLFKGYYNYNDKTAKFNFTKNNKYNSSTVINLTGNDTKVSLDCIGNPFDDNEHEYGLYKFILDFETNKVSYEFTSLKNYTLPVATSDTLGGIKIGEAFDIQDGTLILNNTINIELTTSIPFELVNNPSDVYHALSIGKIPLLDGETFPCTVYKLEDNYHILYEDLGSFTVAEIIISENSSEIITTDNAYATATSAHYGLMSSEDKVKLDSLSNYSLPTATSDTLGGVKVGSGLSIAEDGTLSASATDYTLPVATDTTLGGIKLGNSTQLSIDSEGSLTFNEDNLREASATQKGLMSAEDKSKLDTLSNIQTLTQAEYDALTEKNDTTIYIIKN